eukprot:2102775-Pyramimonas_sp.AAC.1
MSLTSYISGQGGGSFEAGESPQRRGLRILHDTDLPELTAYNKNAKRKSGQTASNADLLAI